MNHDESSKDGAVLYARCDPELHDALTRTSQEIGISVSVLLRDAAETIIKHRSLLGPLLVGLMARQTDDN